MSTSMFTPLVNKIKIAVWSPKPDHLDIYELDITDLSLKDLCMLRAYQFITDDADKFVERIYFKNFKCECFILMNRRNAQFHIADYGDYDDYEDELSGYIYIPYDAMVDGKKPTMDELANYKALETINKVLQSCE